MKYNSKMVTKAQVITYIWILMVLVQIEFVKIKDTSGKWVDLSVCHLINVTAGYKESKLWWDVRWWSLQSTSY